uniref:Uncharacterized protein n=1 Tax=Athene cunicularia TaxID=194338 RepID=A0A663MCK3_ATHCN
MAPWGTGYYKELEAFLLFIGSALALERSLMKLGAREKQYQSHAVRPPHFPSFPMSSLQPASPFSQFPFSLGCLLTGGGAFAFTL